MKSESVQKDYLDLLLKVARLLESTDNSLDRQRSLYYLRQLSTIKISAGDSGVGPTAYHSEVTRRRLELFSLLSNLGTESLLGSER